MSSFLDILQSNDADFEKNKKVDVKNEEEEEEDEYIENVKDSKIVLFLEEISNLCNDFIEDTQFFDKPFIKNVQEFKNDILALFEEKAEIEIVEEYESDSDDSDMEI